MSRLKNLSSSLARWVDTVERLSNLAGSWLIIFLMLLVTCDVASRYLGGKSIAGAYNLAELIMVGICFLTPAYCQKQKGHIRVEIFIDKLRRKPLRFTESAAYLLSFIICVLLFYRSVGEAQMAVDIRLTTMGIVQWPAWPAKIVVPFGFLLLSIRIGLQLARQIRLLVEECKGHAH